MGNSGINFPQMAEWAHGETRRCADIRESGGLREHQPRGPLLGDADLDGKPAAFGARVAARRIAPQAYNATGDSDRAGTRVPQSMPRSPRPLGRRGTGADLGAGEARRAGANVGSGDSGPGAVPEFPVEVPEISAADPSRALHHEHLPRSSCGESRRSDSLWCVGRLE